MKKKLTITAILLLSLFSCSKTGQDGLDGNQVTNVSISNSELSLLVGEEFKLSFTIEPLDATDLRVEWESLRPDIATVDSTGMVKALKPGEVSILLKAQNNVYDVCALTVEPETDFNKMVGHWEGYKIEWVDNVTGEIIPEEDYLRVLGEGYADEYYEAWIDQERKMYNFDLKKDSTMRIGILCMDLNYRFVPGVLTEGVAENTYHGSFEFEGTRYEHLVYLHEIDFKYISAEEHIRMFVQVEGQRFDVIRYYKVDKNYTEQK